MFENYLKAKLGKDKVKIAFHGDQWSSDVHWSNINESWDGIAIVEEMTLAPEYTEIVAGSPFMTHIDPKLIPYDAYWGSNFFIEKNGDETPKRNFFVH